MKRQIIWISVVVIGLLLFGCVGYFFIKGLNNVNQPQTISEENFNLEYVYKGDSQWEYTVTGTLPNPCYAVDTEVLVLESYPEQVRIQITVQEEPIEGVCSTVIQEYSYTDTFNASEKAGVSLEIM